MYHFDMLCETIMGSNRFVRFGSTIFAQNVVKPLLKNRILGFIPLLLVLKIDCMTHYYSIIVKQIAISTYNLCTYFLT